MLALISTLEYFRHYIDGQSVHLSTDHKNITWISNLKGQSGRLGRWVLRLSEFNVVVGYKKGRLMYIADCMSRNPTPVPDDYDPGEVGEPTGLSSRRARVSEAGGGPDNVESHAPAAAAVYSQPEVMITALNEPDCDYDRDGRPRSAALHMIEFCIPSQAERDSEDTADAQRDATARCRRNEGVSSLGKGGDSSEFSNDSSEFSNFSSTFSVTSPEWQQTPIPEHMAFAFAGMAADAEEYSDTEEPPESGTSGDDVLTAASSESSKPEAAPIPSGEGLTPDPTSRARAPHRPAPPSDTVEQPMCNWTASECAAGACNPHLPIVDRRRILLNEGITYDEAAIQHAHSSTHTHTHTHAATKAPAEPEVLQIPEALTPVPISTGQFKQEQAADPVCQELIQQLASHDDGSALSTRLKKFTLIEGVLFRATDSDDPKEGFDSARVYVPKSLVNQVIRNHHSTVWGGHRNVTATFKEIVGTHFWPSMEKDITKFVRECRHCELAKGTKPSRQGFLGGWRHNSVGHMICMDLIGPIGSTNSGYIHHTQPFYVLVITDPFSHMVWMEPLIGKTSEEVYSKFVNGYLLEEGAPLFVLTDNGTEFKNSLLQGLMALLKTRMHFTPSYHPRGNYTERVNRFVGESLRTMLNSDGAKKQNWWQLLKFVQFAYRRMHIPGTNLSPNMISRGRQPLLPSELERVQLRNALPTPPSLDDHHKMLQHNLAVATKLLQAARAEQLHKSRESFNQHQIEVKFQPGERVRLHKRLPLRHGADPDEISSKLKIFNHEYEIVKPIGDSTSRYQIRSTTTGQVTDAHVSQFTRMRSAAHVEPEPDALAQRTPAPVNLSPQEVTALYDRLQAGTYALIWRREDPRSELRVVEIIRSEGRNYVGWYYIHGETFRKGQYNAERAVSSMRLIPEWVNNKTGMVERKPDAAKQQQCRKVLEDFSEDDTELIAAGFPLYKGGKVPEYVAKKADVWLRQHTKTEPRVILVLSFPTDAEEARKAKLNK